MRLVIIDTTESQVGEEVRALVEEMAPETSFESLSLRSPNQFQREVLDPEGGDIALMVNHGRFKTELEHMAHICEDRQVPLVLLTSPHISSGVEFPTAEFIDLGSKTLIEDLREMLKGKI